MYPTTNDYIDKMMTAQCAFNKTRLMDEGRKGGDAGSTPADTTAR